MQLIYGMEIVGVRSMIVLLKCHSEFWIWTQSLKRGVIWRVLIVRVCSVCTYTNFVCMSKWHLRVIVMVLKNLKSRWQEYNTEKVQYTVQLVQIWTWSTTVPLVRNNTWLFMLPQGKASLFPSPNAYILCLVLQVWSLEILLSGHHKLYISWYPYCKEKTCQGNLTRDLPCFSWGAMPTIHNLIFFSLSVLLSSDLQCCFFGSLDLFWKTLQVKG